MIDSSIMIGIAEIQGSLDSKLPLEERLKGAMRAALNHWLVTDEEGQFKIAVGAVMMDATEEEKERIEFDLKFLKAMSSAASGVPVDFARLMKELGEDSATKAVGLRKLWDEVKSEKEQEAQ